MTDYSSAITALIIVTVVISAAVVYVVAQPTDLPRYKENDPRLRKMTAEPSSRLAVHRSESSLHRLG